MTAALFRNARQAVRGHFLDSLRDSVDPTRVAWENDVFDPPNANPTDPNDNPYWIKESCQIVYERLLALELRELIGRTVFSVFYPVGKGTARAENLLQAIANSFESVASVTNGGVVVGIDKVERESGFRSDDAWWMASVSIYFRTYSVATPPNSKI